MVTPAAARWVQALALAVLAVAAVPLTMNQCARIDEREAQARTARLYGTLCAEKLEKGDPVLAVSACREAVELEPRSPARRDALVSAYVAAILDAPTFADSVDAVGVHTELERAMSTRADDARLNLALGRVLERRGDLTAARERFERAVELAPDDALAHLLLGRLLLDREQYDSAAVRLERALELRPMDAHARLALGQVRVHQNRWDDAVELLEAAQDQLDDGQLHLFLGRAQIARGEWAEAARALELAVARSVDAAYKPLGDAWLALQQAEWAMDAYEAAWSKTRDVEALREFARLAQQAGDLQSASEAWRQVRVRFPDDPEPHCAIGAVAEQMRDTQLALGAFGRCAALADERGGSAAELGAYARERLQALEQAPQEPASADDGRRTR